MKHRLAKILFVCAFAVGATAILAQPRPGPSARADKQQLLLEARQRYQEIVRRRDLSMKPEQQLELARHYYGLHVWKSMWYLGIEILKNPTDLWMFQQIIFEVQPDFIVETGTAHGGSALYYAHILDGLGLEDSKVITVDISDERLGAARDRALWKKYVEFVHTSSTDARTVAKIRERVRGKKVLVTLDSLHTRGHVLRELQMYSPLVSPESYIVVEDTFIDGSLEDGRLPGAMSAVIAFLETEQGQLFEQDLSREAMVLTYNPGGWLRRAAPGPR